MHPRLALHVKPVDPEINDRIKISRKAAGYSP